MSGARTCQKHMAFGSRTLWPLGVEARAATGGGQTMLIPSPSEAAGRRQQQRGGQGGFVSFRSLGLRDCRDARFQLQVEFS
jgi:hypothetical protein